MNVFLTVELISDEKHDEQLLGQNNRFDIHQINSSIQIPGLRNVFVHPFNATHSFEQISPVDSKKRQCAICLKQFKYPCP
ncbi:unnamed protein product [Thelazia callipaeda]|uniref:RING-type E3 ubiquitin transferase n=1 Tax=Thelazia callipaeda TaxID=103827 RepID=A0A0N5CSI5_THECL|nr:unnamed protein product [Thelazia callipaeda]